MARLKKSELVEMARRLYGYLRPYWWLLAITIVVMILHSIVSLSRTALAKFLLDDVLLGKSTPLFQNYGLAPFEVLLWLSGAAALLAVVLGITKFFHLFLRDYLNTRVIVDIQKEVFNHMVGLSLRYFNNKKLGDLLSRLTNDMAATTQALKYLYGDFFLQPFMLLAAIIACLIYSWQLSLVTFVIFPAVILPIVRFGKKIHRRARRRQVSVAEVTQEMQQALTGIRVVKSFHGEENQRSDFEEKNEHYFRRAIKVFKTKALAKSFVEILNNLGIAIIMGIGGYFILRGGVDLTPGDLMAFIGATGLMYEPVKKLSKGYNNIQESMASSKRIFEILDEKPDILDGKEARELENINEEVSFDGVTFAYEKDQPVLKDVSFSVNLGEQVAIVGPSGAGKSTMLDLLLRFYDPQEGAIRIDGTDIREFSRASLLKKIAVVGQDPHLFHRTIAENIAFGRPEASEEEIIEAAKAANIHDFIETLPEGYETQVGERGVMLSGGQRQRITIARAICKRFTILLLDEATSSLDTESEQLVQEALDRLMEGYTTFIVAHRLSTIQNADKIILMDNGNLLDIGTHNELYDRAPLYKKLYEMQFNSLSREEVNE